MPIICRRLLFGCFACFFSSFVIYYCRWLAGVAELADATDSKSVELTPHAGSIPATGTEEGVVKRLAQQVF